MSSIVDIYNMALSAVGIQQEVSAVDEASTEAAKCTLFYAASLDRVLRDFDWPFARRYSTLGLIAEAPNPEWYYAYRYPSDALSIRAIVGTSRATAPAIPFAIGSDTTGRLIYTDQATAMARITVRITDTEVFDPLFVTALSNLLGSKIGPPLGRDAKLAVSAFQLYNADLATARANAANEVGQDPAPEAESIRARY